MEDENPVQKKKRKIVINTDDRKKILQEARLHCKSTEQWSVISKLDEKKLNDFVDSSNFDSQQILFDTLFNFTQSILGSALDKIVRGDGHIYSEIMADVSLQQAIRTEASCVIQFLTNRYKILALTIIDTYNGKQKEIANRVPITPVMEEIIKENETDNKSD